MQVGGFYMGRGVKSTIERLRTWSFCSPPLGSSLHDKNNLRRTNRKYFSFVLRKRFSRLAETNPDEIFRISNNLKQTNVNCRNQNLCRRMSLRKLHLFTSKGNIYPKSMRVQLYIYRFVKKKEVPSAIKKF